MGFLQSLFGGNTKIKDPVLGTLERRGTGDDTWSGQVQWQAYAAPTALTVLREDTPPTNDDRNLYLNLKRDWSALRLDLQGARYGVCGLAQPKPSAQPARWQAPSTCGKHCIYKASTLRQTVVLS